MLTDHSLRTRACVRVCLTALYSLFSVFSAQHLWVSQTSPLPATLTKKKEKKDTTTTSITLPPLARHQQLEPQQTRPRENTSDPPPSPSAANSGEVQCLG